MARLDHDAIRCSTYIVLVLFCICNGQVEEVSESVARINRLSDQVRAVLEHYKAPNPEGLPGVTIPDPLQLPDKKESHWGTYLTLKNQQAYGLSKFKINTVYSNLADMEVFIAVSVGRLQVLGNYTLTTFVSSAKGGCTSTFTNFYGEGSAKMEVAKDGHLEATDLKMDFTVTAIDVSFENGDYVVSMMQGVVNLAGTLIMESIKPYILEEINSKVLNDVNKNLRALPMKFPNSLLPLDVCISEARKYVRRKGFDPYKLEDLSHSTGVFGLKVSEIWINGLSMFYRVGNITMEIENNTLFVGISAGTKDLDGSLVWEISLAGLLSTTGKVKFTLEYVEGEIRANQSLDTRNRPNLEDLTITIGNFQIQFDGAGTLDYIIEVIINILPNLLRNHIMLAIEEPLKIKIQEIFNEIDVEKTIIDNLNSLKNPQRNIKVNVMEQTPHEEGLTIDESRLNESIIF